MKSLKYFLLLFVLFVNTPPLDAQQPPPFRSQWTGWSIGQVVIRALAVEGNNVWIGTSNGLIKFNRKKETHQIFNTRTGLLSNIIVSIHPDKKGDIWVGTYGGGLARYDGKNWELFTPYGRGSKNYGSSWAHYRPQNGLGDLWVYDLLFEPDGTMWVATWKGASRRSHSKEDFFTYTMDDGLVDKWVYTVEREPSGILWFGTEGGINRFDGKSWQGWTHKDGLGATITSSRPTPPTDDSYNEEEDHHLQAGRENQNHNPNYVISSAIDKAGILWFGTWGGGLSRFDGKTFKNYTTNEGLPGNIINAIEIDKNGVMWIGTNKGVSRFNGKSFKNFSQKDGLLGDYIYSIAIDDEGSKWFGTFGGVSRYSGS
ncbi:MAG: two-component regulator propeller domain-containing protein [Nitrospiria bacterium]